MVVSTRRGRSSDAHAFSARRVAATSSSRPGNSLSSLSWTSIGLTLMPGAFPLNLFTLTPRLRLWMRGGANQRPADFAPYMRPRLRCKAQARKAELVSRPRLDFHLPFSFSPLTRGLAIASNSRNLGHVGADPDRRVASVLARATTRGFLPMRILLATAVAIAPLMVAAGAQAEQVISNGRTTPISTSTANNGARDDVRIANGGSIAVTSGAAVTLDSSNSVKLDAGSKIDMLKAADGATGILANGGNTGDITIGGAITITDAIDEYKDDDKDGDLDGPFAEGNNRYGVRVTGASPLTGNIRSENSGSIRVEGNNSAGLSVEAPSTGKIVSLGQIHVIGDNGYGVRTTGDVSGDVTLLGGIGVVGENSSGVAIDGDVGGQVKIQGAVTATGYRYTPAP